MVKVSYRLSKGQKLRVGSTVFTVTKIDGDSVRLTRGLD